MANKINRTDIYPNTTPANGDYVLGVDVSNTTNDENGEVVTFRVNDILATSHSHQYSDIDGFPKFFDTIADLLADTSAYTAGTILITNKEGARYTALASGATDFSDTNAGGQKLMRGYQVYDTVSDLLASVEPSRGVGSIWEAAGYRYEEVSSGGDLANAASVQFDLLPTNEGSFAQASGTTASALSAVSSGGKIAFGRGSFAQNSAISIGNEQSISGQGTRATTLLNSASTAAISAQGGAGTTKHFGLDFHAFEIDSSSPADTTGAGLDLKNQGLTSVRLVNVSKHQGGGLKAEAVVGLRQFANNFNNNNYAEVYNSPSPLASNTTVVSFGTKRGVMLSGIKNSGTTKQYVSFGGVWENFNTLVENTGSIWGFNCIGDWFEAYGTGRVVEAADGTLSIGTASDSKIDIGGVSNPNLTACYFSGEPTITNAFNPRIEKAVIAPAGAVAAMYAKDLLSDGQFELDASEFLWGAAATGETAFGLKSNMPTHGSLSTPDEQFYKAGTFDSVAAANQSGIWSGSAGAAVNYVWKSVGDNAFPGASNRIYWPYTQNSPSRTTGINDPYGGTTAVQVDNGQYGSSNIPFATDGGVWATIVVVYRAVSVGDVLHFSLYHVGGPGVQYNKTIEFEVPDTDWRIANFTQYLPVASGINFRFRLGTTTGGQIQFARACLYEGAKVLPPLNLEQQISQPFIFEHGNVVLSQAAAPTAGRFYAGDRVRYPAPTASGKIGAVCVTSGSPGTWKEYGAIDA